MTSLVVMSGGLDSTTTLYRALSEVDEVSAIGFDYGQRHKKELLAAGAICDDLGIDYKVVDITSITNFLAPSGSSLVSDTEVPEGHYAEENMKATVVPNRNMIMASIAAGHAIAIDAEFLYMGVHAGDHFIYPDCRPEFFAPLNAAVVRGNAGFGKIKQWNEDASLVPQDFILTPYIKKTKADIAVDAFKFGVPIEMTWSCYKGGDIHCGKCGTCVERIEALADAAQQLTDRDAGIEPGDPTEYEDREFWREALKRETV